MLEELKRIIKKAKEDNYRLEERVDNLKSKVRFCSDHKFEEGKRVALLQLNAIEMSFYRQGKIIEELESLVISYKQA